jgi:DNA-binding winged helix-turn-helix (wHTH) protein
MTREELIEELSFLRGVMYGEPRDQDVRALCRRFNLYPAEARILDVLNRASGRVVAKWRLCEEMLPERVEERASERNSLNVRLSRVRARLGRGTVETVLSDTREAWGYRLTTAGRHAVAQALGRCP